MAARSKARKRALDLLFAAEARGTPAVAVLDAELAESANDKGARPVAEYTERIVRGVQEHRARIDEVISSYARDWSLERMPSVDRNVLRLSVFELLYVDEVPVSVAVSEALHLVRELSTDESPSFVNGVLGNVVRHKSELVG